MTERIRVDLKQYREICDEIFCEFALKQGYVPESADDLERTISEAWTPADIRETACLGDRFYDFQDILTDLAEDAPAGEIDRWSDYCDQCRDLGIGVMNYRSWLHGAPRRTDEIEHIRQLRDRLRRETDEFNEEHRNNNNNNTQKQ